MSHDRAMQVNQHRTFLQPQGLDHGQHQHPLHEPASPCTMATEGVFPPQHAQAQDSFRVIVRGLDPLDRREQPQRRAGYSAKRLKQKVAALESAQERPCSKMPWSSRAIGFNLACRPARSSSPPRNAHQSANRHSTGPMLGNSALSTNESPPVFRDEMVSCIDLTRRNTCVDVRWFLSSLFAGGPHTRAGLEMSRSRRSQRLETEISF